MISDTANYCATTSEKLSSTTLRVWPSNLEKDEAQRVLGNLTIRAMQHNYAEMMQAYDNDAKRVHVGMLRLFGKSWVSAKESIFQWYDKEFTCEVE